MPGYLDFEQIKADNPIDRVAENEGLELKKSGQQLRGPCPTGKGGERSFVITPDKGKWYSFAAETGGDVISLVSFIHDCSAKEAASMLAERSGTVPEKRRSKPSSPQGKEARGGFRPLDYLQADHPAVEALGMTEEDAEALGWGFAPRGMMKGLVAVPIRRDDGTLAGYIGIEEARLPKEWK